MTVGKRVDGCDCGEEGQNYLRIIFITLMLHLQKHSGCCA